MIACLTLLLWLAATGVAAMFLSERMRDR